MIMTVSVFVNIEVCIVTQLLEVDISDPDVMLEHERNGGECNNPHGRIAENG